MYIYKFNLFYTYLSYNLFYRYSITISKILVSKSSFFLMLHFYLITLIRISNTSPTYSKLNMFHSYLCGFFPTRRRDGVRIRHPLSDPSHPIVILLWTYWLECFLQIEVYTKLNMLTPTKSQREPSSFCLECLKLLMVSIQGIFWGHEKISRLIKVWFLAMISTSVIFPTKTQTTCSCRHTIYITFN